jgi:chromosome partitioning protein
MLAEVRAVNEDLRAAAFINRADPKGADNQAAREMLAQGEGIEVLDARLGNFKAFPNAFVEGLGVVEMKPRHADAIAGITGLYQAIFDTMSV